MSSDRNELGPEAAQRMLQRVTRALDLANAVLDEWDQDRGITNVSGRR
jgi:hypothetical protein